MGPIAELFKKVFSPSSHNLAPQSNAKSKRELGTIEKKYLLNLNHSHLPGYRQHKVLRLRNTFSC